MVDFFVTASILSILAIGNIYGIRRLDPTLFFIGLMCCFAVYLIIADIDNSLRDTTSSWLRAAITLIAAAAGIFTSALGWFFLISAGGIRIMTRWMDRPRRMQDLPSWYFNPPSQPEYRPPTVREPPQNLRPDAELDDRYLDRLIKQNRHGYFEGERDWRQELK